MKPKSKVVLSLSELSIPDKVNKAFTFKTALTGNEKFTGTAEMLTRIEAAADALQTAYQDAQQLRNESITKTAVMKQLEGELDALLTSLGLMVEAQSNGDAAAIKSAGMDVKRPPAKAGIPGLPDALAATEGSKQGSIALKWKAVRGSRSYLIRATRTVGEAASWQQVAVCTRANTEVSGLASGQQYWFQVSAVGSAGQGPWSDPATKIVP
jgi:Fibronectin type III domain